MKHSLSHPMRVGLKATVHGHRTEATRVLSGNPRWGCYLECVPEATEHIHSLGKNAEEVSTWRTLVQILIIPMREVSHIKGLNALPTLIPRYV